MREKQDTKYNTSFVKQGQPQLMYICTRPNYLPTNVCLTMAMVKIEKIHTTLLIMHALTESAFGDMGIGKQE